MLKESITLVFTKIINSMINVAWEYVIIIILAFCLLIVILLYVSKKEKYRGEMRQQKNEHVPLSLNKTRNVSCVKKGCNGHYVLRSGKYGNFAGCSEYPRCNSTMKVYDLVLLFIQTYGMNIYQWEKECWKCKKLTPVYSYYLHYDLSEISDTLGAYDNVGIGDLPCVDKLLSKRFSTVKEQYSKTISQTYMANSCKYCGALQGKNYVVEDPHEIFNELYHAHDMEKYLFETLYFGNTDLLKSDIIRIYGDRT